MCKPVASAAMKNSPRPQGCYLVYYTVNTLTCMWWGFCFTWGGKGWHEHPALGRPVVDFLSFSFKTANSSIYETYLKYVTFCQQLVEITLGLILDEI